MTFWATTARGNKLAFSLTDQNLFSKSGKLKVKNGDERAYQSILHNGFEETILLQESVDQIISDQQIPDINYLLLSKKIDELIGYTKNLDK